MRLELHDEDGLVLEFVLGQGEFDIDQPADREEIMRQVAQAVAARSEHTR